MKIEKVKKEKELILLRKHYSEKSFEILENSENPDFILKNKETGEIIGVEITNYYDSETSGRFKNIPNYAQRLTDQEFIHKKDKDTLQRIDTMEIVHDDGSTTPMPVGIMRELPQWPERIEELKKTVANKNIKFNQYNKNLKNIDLLIFDSGDLIAGIDIQKKEILEYLRIQEEANSLKSPFRNIILLIQNGSDNVLEIMLKSA